MLKSSVLKIIQSFSEKEIAEFNDFLNSPYHNKKSGVIKLYNEIKKYYPDFTDENLDKEKLWRKLFPDKKYSYGVMKNLIFDITKLAEQFITQQAYRANEVQEFANLYRSLGERKLKSVLDNKESYLNKKFGDDGLKDIKIPLEDFYSNLIRIYDVKIWQTSFFDETVSLEKESAMIDDLTVCEMFIRLFVNYYMSAELSMNKKCEYELRNNSKHVLEILTKDSFEKILDRLKERSEIKYKLLNCYYLGYKVYTNLNSSDYFFQFKNFFNANYNFFPESAIRDLDEILEYCGSKSDDLSVDKDKEYYERYEFRFVNNLVLDRNGRLNAIQFLQWILIFFSENKLSEMNDFTGMYKKYLADDINKKAVLSLTGVLELFMKLEYGKSLNRISQIKFNSDRIKTFAKKLKLMILYEINDYETFLCEFDSLMHFLKYSELNNNEVTKLKMKRAKKFSMKVKKLFKLRETTDNDEIKLFEREIDVNNVDMKKWFLKKINEIKISKTKLSA